MSQHESKDDEVPLFGFVPLVGGAAVALVIARVNEGPGPGTFALMGVVGGLLVAGVMMLLTRAPAQTRRRGALRLFLLFVWFGVVGEIATFLGL